MPHFLLSGTACTWVKETDEAKGVAVLNAEQIQNCKRLGEVNSSVKDSVLGIGRKDSKVQTELNRLAQNQAASMGANAIVLQSSSEGSANYVAYSCP